MDRTEKPVHPGQYLKQKVIKPLGLTVTEAAQYLGVTRKTLSALINGKAMLSPEMAIRIGTATGTSPARWYSLQADLDMWYAAKKKIERQVNRFENNPNLSSIF
ncbi:HigA family addiction module antidote protein [bacterium]|nr:HigA family addiction module antidote protein [bacterium]